MCTGIEPWVIASLAGGTGAQIHSNKMKADAMEDAAKAEYIRQQGFDQKKVANFQDALAEASAPQQQERLGTAQGDIAADLTAGSAVPSASYTSPGSTAPRVVQDYTEKATAGELDFVNSLANPRAKLGAWREGMTDFATLLGEKGWQTDELNRRLGRSAQIGQMEAQEAYQNTGNELALAGNLATTVGGIGLGNALFARGAAPGAAPSATGTFNPAALSYNPQTFNPYQSLIPRPGF
jgi:hypothetical protein